MIRLLIDSAWYGEALVGGAYAVSGVIGSKTIYTHNGPISVDRDLLFTVCSSTGRFKFAGQDQAGGAGGGNYESNADLKLSRVGESFGVYPLIYRADGSLVQVAVGESHQGWRYIDANGKLVSGDELVYDPINSINEPIRAGSFI